MSNGQPEKKRKLAPTEDACPLRNTNPLVGVMLTDLYQITMGYAYWKSNKQDQTAIFDLFFRKSPFHGEFTLFGGLDEAIKLVAGFKFSKEDIEYLRATLPPSIEPEFYTYLAALDCSQVTMCAQQEGSVVFPRVPLIRLEGPLLVVQLLETPLLTLINYASLVSTNAARMRIAAGPKIELLEFGLRRAQGPDGGVSASRYCYTGGFDATSNVLAGKLFQIPIKGTHAHAFVTSYSAVSDTCRPILTSSDGKTSANLMDLSMKYRGRLEELGRNWGASLDPNDNELLAFVAYAHAFPKIFLALIDTYEVLKSGVANFCAVALALHELGYKAVGIRLDSGDLAYLSKACRVYFQKVSAEFEGMGWLFNATIVASNDINEETLYSLKNQGHAIDAFGVGTHLVTCQSQPALGCVFKLVSINNEPRMKLSQDVQKVTIPDRKDAFRLYGKDGSPLIDFMTGNGEEPPQVGEKIMCRDPFQESRRCFVTPWKVEPLLLCHWADGKLQRPLDTLTQIKQRTTDQIKCVREDTLRALNPTPYKVSVSDALYKKIHNLWLSSSPISELY